MHNYVGRCLVDHDKKMFWINIPKNASNSVSYHLIRQMKWKDDHFINNPAIRKYRGLGVVREPLKRWHSCTLELCFHFFQYHRDDHDLIKFKDWFAHKNFENFDKNLDIHHIPQSAHLEADFANLTLIAMEDPYFETKVANFFNISGDLVKRNVTVTNDQKLVALQYVDRLMTDAMIQKLKNFYANDIKIHQQILTG